MTRTVRNTPPRDVANSVGVSVDSIGRYAREGLIPFETTPKGHRRYNVDEVLAALSDLEGPSLSRMRTSTAPRQSRLALGPPVNPSASALLREDLRATRTAPADTVQTWLTDAGEVPEPALCGFLDHARRILVAAGR